MSVIASALLFLVVKRRVVVKPSRDPVSATFQSYGHPKANAVWVDGQDTGVRIPKEDTGFFNVEERSNRRGDLGGEFSQEYRGAMDGTHHFPFAKRRQGRFVILPPDASGNNPAFIDLDAKGRVLTVDDPEMTSLTVVRHAHIWTGVRWTDLGPADHARFDHDGSVFGTFASDRKGLPLEPIDSGGEGFAVRFRWKDGKRTESKPYQA